MVSILFIVNIECSMPKVKDVNKGEVLTIDCDLYQGLQFCVANYILRGESYHSMVNVDPSEYKFESKKVILKRVDDVGFYACAINCSNVNYFDIFFLQTFGIFKFIFSVFIRNLNFKI